MKSKKSGQADNPWVRKCDVDDERDLRLDTCLQGGLVTRTNGRTIRLFGQWYDGRPTIGQFTAYSEAAISVGLRVDL